MNKRRLRDIGLGAWTKMRQPYYQGASAELAFFFLISIIPLFMVLAEVLGIFSISADIVRLKFDEYAESEFLQAVADLFDYSPSGTANVMFVCFALWAASKAQYSLIRIANYTYTGRTAENGYVRERFRSIVTVLLPIVLLAVAFAVLLYGGSAAGVVDFYLGILLNHEDLSILQELWSLLRWPMYAAVYFGGISLIYYLLPTKKIRFRDGLPGSLLASVGMFIVTMVYAYYIDNFSNFSVLYGSLAAVIGLILWFYALGFVLIIGIVFNAAILDDRELRTGIEKELAAFEPDDFE